MFSSAEIRKAVDKVFLGYRGNSFRLDDVIFLTLQLLGVSPANYYWHRQDVEKYLWRSHNRNGKLVIINGCVRLRNPE